MTASVASRPPLPRIGLTVLAATGLGILLAVLGPFGSYLNHGALLRSVYWIGGSWLGFGLYGAGMVASRRLSLRDPWRRWMALALVVLGASVPQALATRSAAFAIWPELHRYGPSWLGWYAQVVTVGAAAVLGATLLLDSRERQDRAVVPAANAATASKIAQQTPLGDVIALQMEDHYVRVHTAAGSTLVHMPLTQAIEQVGPIEGLRTHRSWWVARHAVKRVEGSPRSMRLYLRGDLTAPVARSSVTILRTSGWLDESVQAPHR